MAKTKKGISKKTIAAVGVGAAVAAVGAYWFYGSKNAAAHRKTARGWMLKARGDVLAAVENVVKKAGEIDKKAYMNIVQGVLKRYSKLSGVTSAEILQMTRDMNEAWLHMQKVRKSRVSKTAKKASKSRKKKR